MQLRDEKKFESLFREHYSELCNYAYTFIADADLVEDIVQNFFIIVWERKHLSVTTETFLPYAYRSVKNSCLNYYKSEVAKEDFFQNLTIEWKEQLKEEDDFIYKKDVQLAFRKLPDKCRKVFLLRYVSGLRYKEIAEITGISVNTVKYHMGEAFRIMKEELKHLTFLFFLIFF